MPNASRSVRVRLAAPVALALACAALGACDGVDATGAMIEEARRTLASTHLAGATPTAEGFREERYAQVVNTLRPATQQGSGRQRAAAHALIGQAQGGQAEILAARATAMERSASDETARLASVFEHLVVGLRAQAAAATVTATTADQQQVATQVRQVEAERAEHAQRLATLRSEIDALRQQVSTAGGAGAEARSREAALRAQLLDATGEQRTTLVVQAVEAQREAAGHDRDRATIDSRLSVLQPEAAQAQREIDSLTRRIDLLNDSRRRMQSLDQALRERAGEDLRLAEQSGEALVRDLTALDALRQSDLADAYSAGVAAYGQAISAMRQATSGAGDARPAAMVSLGALQQSLADLHAARARGLERYATLLARLLEADPALPQASMIRQYLERVRTDASAAQQAALDGYEEASESYGGSQARGELRERIDALIGALAQPEDGAEAPADEDPGEEFPVDEDAGVDG